MKTELAESILTKAIDWGEQTSDELQDIQVIAEYKYNDYQQYTHGMRYIESLALWLRRFKEPSERKIAYQMIKKRLVFISEEQMRQIVSVSFPICIHGYIMGCTKRYCDDHSITDVNERKKLYEYFRRKTLFLGMSDGSHMDHFRRQNSQLSNEQVFISYDFSTERAEGMLRDLEKDLNQISKDIDEEKTFCSFFLIDDFSASGISYIRAEKSDNGELDWRGKIPRFYGQLERYGFLCEGIELHVVLYVATQKALEHIRVNAEKFLAGKNILLTVDTLQIVESAQLRPEEEELLRKNYEEHQFDAKTFVDVHFKKGNMERPYMGFDGCALPLVIYHNTPNNAFPIIWHAWEGEHALFPRTTRHKEA